MPQQKPHKTSPRPQSQDVTAGKGRRDEVGKTGIYPSSGPFPEHEAPVITPGDLNAPHEPRSPGVRRSEELKGVERLRRKGNEMDKVDSDLLAE
jgi:hypothetical protein